MARKPVMACLFERRGQPTVSRGTEARKRTSASLYLIMSLRMGQSALHVQSSDQLAS